MRRSLFLTGTVSAVLALPGTSACFDPLRAEKPRVADAVASFLDSLAGPSRGHGPTCGCGGYAPQPEPTCEAEPLCGAELLFAAEPTCGVEPLCGVEPISGTEIGGGIASDFDSEAFAPRSRERHAPIRMRIQSHPPTNVDRTFAPAHRLPPAPTLPSVEREHASAPAKKHAAPLPVVREPEPPVASMPLPLPEPTPDPVREPDLMPVPESMPEPAPEPESAPRTEPKPILNNDPVQAAPLPRPKPPEEQAPALDLEEPAVSPEAAPTAPEAPLPKEEPAIPAPKVEPLPTAPSEATPPPAKLTPEPRRMPSPPRPLSNALPYDPTDPFADPPAPEAPAFPATPTTEDRAPARFPSEPEIPRFGEEEFAPVGTGLSVQPASGVMGRASAVRPALRIVPANDRPLSLAR